MTDKAPSNNEAEIAWAHGFVYGLVPPINAPLNAEEECGDAGVSEVYFRQTFIQVLAQGLTSSLYSPQRLTTTCAAGGGMSVVPPPPSYLLQISADLTADGSEVESSTTDRQSEKKK